MALTSTAKRLDETQVELEPKRPGFAGGEPPPVLLQTPIGNNVWLAVFDVPGAGDVFMRLMGAYIVFAPAPRSGRRRFNRGCPSASPA
jgi:hypothetical protein